MVEAQNKAACGQAAAGSNNIIRLSGTARCRANNVLTLLPPTAAHRHLLMPTAAHTPLCSAHPPLSRARWIVATPH
jgi:hypothetical protein